MSRPIPNLTLSSGQTVARLGQGTWYMGESRAQAKAEADALRLGIDLGMTVIDTAEMYADGGAERVVGAALAGRRDEVFLVSKVLPYNASYDGTLAACERSLKRLGTDRIDLYLLHWRGSHPFAETLDAFNRLIEQGKIVSWGVSNLDPDDMDELLSLPGGSDCAVNQVLYNPTRRGIEYDLMPQCRDAGIAIMAYSPIEQGRMLKDAALAAVARRHDATPAQVALAWGLRHPHVIAIPKAGKPDHVRENRAATDLVLTAADFAELDKAYPPPTRAHPLEML